MRRLTTLLSLMTLLIATPAIAQIDIELGFEPEEAAPGDVVIFSGSLDSSFEEELDAEFEFSASFNQYEIGPFSVELPICALQHTSFSIPLPVPMHMSNGDLTISVTVTARGMSDTAVATLAITGGEGPDPTSGLAGMTGDIMFKFGCDEVPTSMGSIGTMKANW